MMNKYDYRKAMKHDVNNAIAEYMLYENITASELPEHVDELYSQLWIDDAVTGNGSGSYTFDRERAKNMVIGNDELLTDTINEFCIEAETVGKKFIGHDWEYFDVSIRCYLLGEILDEAIEETSKQGVTL